MTTPFDRFKGYFSEVPIEAPTRIILSCKVCHREIARSDLPSQQWVHLDDEMRISPDATRITHSTYDHIADPDVLDCEGWEDDD